MAANIERRHLARQPDSIVKSFAVRHQRRRREHAVPMRFDDPGVYIFRKAEIVSVNNEPLHCSKYMQLDAQEFLRICAEIFQRCMQLPHHAGGFFIQRRIHH